VPRDSLAAPLGLLITPYHVGVYAAARAGRRVAVAPTLLHAVRHALHGIPDSHVYSNAAAPATNGAAACANW
jgi:hypothetical protein